MTELDAAGRMAQEGWKPGMAELKPDGSLVTPYDQKIEERFRAALPGILPGSTVWGEEMGFEEPGPSGLWMLDPIDGTSNYAFGLAGWGISLALAQEGRITAGFIWEPDLRLKLWAVDGGPVQSERGELAACRPGPILAHELVGHGSISIARRLRWPGKLRHLGSFVSEGSQLARGGFRAITTGRVKLYDCAAGLLFSRIQGFELRHLDGEPLVDSEWMKPAPMKPFAVVPPDSGLSFSLSTEELTGLD